MQRPRPPSAATVRSPSPGDVAGLRSSVRSVAHEARHGEEWFLGARFAAAKGMSAPEIATAQQIDGDIAAIAAARKLDGLTAQSRKLAEQMYGATIDDRATHAKTLNDTGYEMLAMRRDDARAARDALRAAPSEAGLTEARTALQSLRRGMELVIEKYLAYRAIPFEADAHEVDVAAEVAFEATR